MRSTLRHKGSHVQFILKVDRLMIYPQYLDKLVAWSYRNFEGLFCDKEKLKYTYVV